MNQRACVWVIGVGHAVLNSQSNTISHSKFIPVTMQAMIGCRVRRIPAGNMCALFARYLDAKFVLMHISLSIQR